MKKFLIKERKQLDGSKTYIVHRKDLWGRIRLWDSVNYEGEGLYCEFTTLQEAKRYIEYHSNPKEKIVE